MSEIRAPWGDNHPDTPGVGMHILAHLPNLPGAACIEHRDVSAPDFFQLSAEQSTVMTDRALRERHTHMTQADPA